ncbi:hypothetical protein ABPG74_005929 [Tetrahymena malaccensis]
MFKLKRLVQNVLVRSVVTTLIVIASIQAIISYKTLSIIFLKEGILKTSTTNSTNIFIEDQKQWLVGNNQDKLLFIVIDSLGHYLAKPNLSSLSQILEKEPNNTIFLKTKTDSLTVTGPRLLSMMTGTNPTLIDLIQNVEHSKEIKIDNILEKLKAANKTSFFTGDNTWLKLFPNIFTNFTNNDSFNIFGESDEDEITFKLVMEQLNQETPVDVIIAHFLGIDHSFHGSKNVYNSDMPSKYDNYNKFIEQFIEQLEDRTIVICSDHGSTPKGTHGDDSLEETETFFFMYRKKGFAKNQQITQQIMENIPNYPINNINNVISSEQCNKPDLTKQYCGQFEGMLQLDVAINLANVLGLSIPYSSLGMIWPIFNNQYKEGDQVEESKFKDAVARNTYTVLKQQIKIIKINEATQNKIGDKFLKRLSSDEQIIDQLFNQFQKDNSVQKLRLLFEKCFDLNLQIKESLKQNSSKQTKDEMIQMAFVGISVLILILLIVIQINEYINNESQDQISLLSSLENQNSQSKYKLVLITSSVIIGVITCIALKYFFTLNCLIYTCAVLILMSIISQTNIKKILTTYILRRNLLIIIQIIVNFYLISLQELFIETQDADIFKIMVWTLILYCVTNCLKGFKYIITLFSIVLLSQYSMISPSALSTPSLYYFPKEYIQIPSLTTILNSTILSILLPATAGILLLNYLLFRFFPSTEATQFQRYKHLFYIQYFLSFLFISVTDMIPQISSSNLILVYLPRMQLILFCYQTYFLFKKLIWNQKQVLSENNSKNSIQLTFEGKILLFLLNFMSLNFIFIGQKSFYATFLFFSFVFLYRKYLNIIRQNHSFLQVLVLFILSFFFFFVTDHKYSFGGLQIKAGYIGMGQYIESYALVFIIINSITWQLYALAIYPVFAKAGHGDSINQIIFEQYPNTYNSLEQQFEDPIKHANNKIRLTTILDYFYFYLLFSFKFFFILRVFSTSLSNDQTHRQFPYLMGEMLFTNTAIPIILSIISLIKYQKEKEIPYIQV